MIASWMIYTAVLGGVLIGAAHCLAWGARLLGRPTRGVWAAALALGLALPFLTLLRPIPPPVAPDPISGVVATTPMSLAGTTVMLPVFPAPPGLDRAVLIGWAAASLLLIGALLHGMGVLQGRRREWRRTEVNGRVVLVAPDLGPAVIGWRRSQVVLPLWVLALDAQTRELILVHEEEHIRSHDPALLVGGLVAAALMPWDIPLWYLHRRLRLAIELDCDARVLAGGAEVTRYGEVLLEAGARCRGARIPALAPFAERASQLGVRIDAMTRGQVSRPVPRAIGAALVAAVLLVAACSFENPLGIDLTTLEQPVTVRSSVAEGELVNFEMIRLIARRAAEEMYPGALASGGIPIEAVVVVTLDASRRVMSVWMPQPGTNRGFGEQGFPLEKLKGGEIKSVEVLKGKVIGIENLGVIVITLKPDAAGERETPVNPARLLRSRLEQRDAAGGGDVRILLRGGDSARAIVRERPPR
ncbi:MAG: M56 family metallopeptidase [Gemmatimonadota bacterium]|nr:M56 family metallopeptidase [Gemmatimonadota bacterium]